jgi:hypothetical protein
MSVFHPDVKATGHSLGSFGPTRVSKSSDCSEINNQHPIGKPPQPPHYSSVWWSTREDQAEGSLRTEVRDIDLPAFALDGLQKINDVLRSG